MIFDDETEQAIDEYVEEQSEARREHDLVFWEGCAVVTVPAGAPPEYITVMVDGVNDPNVNWRGVPPAPGVGDEVLVFENPITHRREIVGGSGATGATISVGTQGFFWKTDGVTNDWRRIATHTCHVGPGTECEASTLGAAVAIVNAAGPTAANPWVILVDAIVTAEAGDVTVPQYCYVEGRGESSVIGMGINTLILSDDSGLERITVTSSDPVDAIRMNNVNNVVLRNVSSHQFDDGDCFHILGTSVDVWMYGCVAFSGGLGTAPVGYHIGDTAVSMLMFCEIAEGDAFMATGLLIDADASLTHTKWCNFDALTDVNVGVGSDWYHLGCRWDPDNSTIAAGTHHALITKRFNQTLLVAEEGGDFRALSEAVAWVNAQADAAANKLYGIEMLVGNFAEAANVTIPQYTHVWGAGEGTEVEMGANQLILSADTSLMDVVVEGNPGAVTGLVYANNADNVVLRNVHSIESSAAGYNFRFSGSTNAKLYDCLSETSGGAATGYLFDGSGGFELYNCRADAGDTASIGFNVQATSTVLLEDCVADDTSNFATALNLTDTVCEATTRHCTFRANTNDVATGAASTWEHIKCHYDANNSTIAGTETPLRDGAVEIASDAIRSHNSLFPDIGTTTLAQKFGDVYLARCYDVYPDHDVYGLWTRMVNFGVPCPDEHWHQNADDLAWTGWANYVGYATPNNIAHTNSQKRVRHNAATRAFYYRAAPVAANIFLRQGVSIMPTAAGIAHAGVMIDDGVDAADGLGANNYYRVMLESTGTTTNWNIRREYRVGGGAPVAAVTAFSLQPGDFYCPILVGFMNPNWGNWWAGLYYQRNACQAPVQFDNPPFTWTPVHVGLYYYINAVNTGFGIWDWYDEDTS